MARRSGFSEHTLRYYEDIGLIGPVPRDESSGHRRYPPEAAERIEALACLRATGMSIDDMRAYLRGLSAGRAAATEMVDLFSGHAARLEEELTALRLRLDYVRAKAELWQSRVDDDEPREQQARALSSRLAQRLRGEDRA
ncbi:MerR family transcriptional regulator [Nocardioides anomalus]|uniref:MerR family transcriptional regulator n=2 Tax=Nocardioides anomalus TaxID=2712223 RepID=A0A6G6WL99_9ACTN|nr:MerR family transcriptional regulator [Nocardioides anomalus]